MSLLAPLFDYLKARLFALLRGAFLQVCPEYASWFQGDPPPDYQELGINAANDSKDTADESDKLLGYSYKPIKSIQSIKSIK